MAGPGGAYARQTATRDSAARRARGIPAGASAAVFAATISVTLVVSYAVNLVCVLVVRRGVKDPAKMKLGMVLFGILSVLALVSLVKALLDGTGLEALTQSVATAVMNCCVFYGALKLNASAK